MRRSTQSSWKGSAIRGALTGVALAALLGGFFSTSSAPPSGIEADAFAAYLDRSEPVAAIAGVETPTPSDAVALR